MKVHNVTVTFTIALHGKVWSRIVFRNGIVQRRKRNRKLHQMSRVLFFLVSIRSIFEKKNRYKKLLKIVIEIHQACQNTNEYKFAQKNKFYSIFVNL